MNRLKTLLTNPWLWGAFTLCILLPCLTPWVYPGVRPRR